jgi:hypothetical protein
MQQYFFLNHTQTSYKKLIILRILSYMLQYLILSMILYDIGALWFNFNFWAHYFL